MASNILSGSSLRPEMDPVGGTVVNVWKASMRIIAGMTGMAECYQYVQPALKKPEYLNMRKIVYSTNF